MDAPTRKNPRPKLGDAPTESEPPPPPPHTPPAGIETKGVTGFTILRELGRGGTGTVHLARQEPLDRLVALKILDPALASDDTFTTRFYREAKSAALFQHPNVVAVHAAGDDPNTGAHWIAFQFIRGGSVEDLLLRDGYLTERRALELILGVAKALVFAEAQGLVHRDVKPGNILLDSDGTPKLADLGLAKQQDPDAQPITQQGIVVGTPYYMAPEQALGCPDLDGRADIYSLGLCLWRMLTGRIPFLEEGEGGAALVKVLARRLNKSLPDVRDVVRDTSEGSATILRGMTARRRRDRYASAREVVGDVERVLSGKPALGPQPTSQLKSPVAEDEDTDPLTATAADLDDDDDDVPALTDQARIDTRRAPRPVPPPKPRSWSGRVAGLGVAIGIGLGSALLGQRNLAQAGAPSAVELPPTSEELPPDPPRPPNPPPVGVKTTPTPPVDPTPLPRDPTPVAPVGTAQATPPDVEPEPAPRWSPGWVEEAGQLLASDLRQAEARRAALRAHPSKEPVRRRFAEAFEAVLEVLAADMPWAKRRPALDRVLEELGRTLPPGESESLRTAIQTAFSRWSALLRGAKEMRLSTADPRRRSFAYEALSDLPGAWTATAQARRLAELCDALDGPALPGPLKGPPQPALAASELRRGALGRIVSEELSALEKALELVAADPERSRVEALTGAAMAPWAATDLVRKRVNEVPAGAGWSNMLARGVDLLLAGPPGRGQAIELVCDGVTVRIDASEVVVNPQTARIPVAWREARRVLFEARAGSFLLRLPGADPGQLVLERQGSGTGRFTVRTLGVQARRLQVVGTP